MTFTQKNLHRKDHAILVGLIKLSFPAFKLVNFTNMERNRYF